MKKILILLLVGFASCKVTNVVKCECKGKVEQAFNPWTIPMPSEGHKIFPILKEPLPDDYKPDTIYILSSIDTMLPVTWIPSGDTSILRSHKNNSL